MVGEGGATLLFFGAIVLVFNALRYLVQWMHHVADILKVNRMIQRIHRQAGTMLQSYLASGAGGNRHPRVTLTQRSVILPESAIIPRKEPVMPKRMTCLLAAGALILPLPAYADCAERIAAIESHPAILETPESAAAPDADTRSPAPAADSEEEVVEEEMVEEGEAVVEDGGETVHADGGPAEPRESWFTNGTDEERGVVLTHLDAAREAQSSGDEQACMEHVQQAENLLRNDAG